MWCSTRTVLTAGDGVRAVRRFVKHCTRERRPSGGVFVCDGGHAQASDKPECAMVGIEVRVEVLEWRPRVSGEYAVRYILLPVFTFAALTGCAAMNTGWYKPG